ncbi:hypothetical protein [Xanthomonas theicola]|uniref:hypothetical protein n=1 Tax=Xanthomonas theicola TaxID=56464 RepID=UPI000FF87853|nr:hypothetical protein [Xanthomonas theicola]QNH25474.1 hypothetical protein G4Q83_12975 [Xanthomonas theicola]
MEIKAGDGFVGSVADAHDLMYRKQPCDRRKIASNSAGARDAHGNDGRRHERTAGGSSKPMGEPAARGSAGTGAAAQDPAHRQQASKGSGTPATAVLNRPSDASVKNFALRDAVDRPAHGRKARSVSSSGNEINQIGGEESTGDDGDGLDTIYTEERKRGYPTNMRINVTNFKWPSLPSLFPPYDKHICDKAADRLARADRGKIRLSDAERQEDTVIVKSYICRGFNSPYDPRLGR